MWSGIRCGGIEFRRNKRLAPTLPPRVINRPGRIAMAQFLTTAGIGYQLEELIKSAKERLILISPYLKVDERLRVLVGDKDRDCYKAFEDVLTFPE